MPNESDALDMVYMWASVEATEPRPQIDEGIEGPSIHVKMEPRRKLEEIPKLPVERRSN